ncbi:MAG: ATP-binding protein [Cytophagales bacterium]|nr:ATP-binding protein [Cytophagales bacterium]
MRQLIRFTLALLFALVHVSFSYAQNKAIFNPLIDSLKKELNFASDSTKVDLLNKIAYNYYYFNNDSIETYAVRSVELARKLGYKRGLSEALRMMGTAYKVKNQGGKAVNWLFEGLKTARSINYHQGIADNLNSLGILYKSIEDAEQALRYFKQSVEHQRLAENSLREGLLYNNIAVIYLDNNELDSSEYYFNKSLMLLDSIGDEKWLAMVYSQYGALLIKQEQVEEAYELSNRALEISIRTGQSFHLRKSYQNLAEIYLLRRDYKKSSQMAGNALQLSREIKFFPFIIEAFEVLYRINRDFGYYKKALDHHEKYTGYKDSMRIQQLQIESDLLNFLTELDSKERENMNLRKENRSRRAQNIANEALIYRQTIIGIGILIILVFVSILATIFFRLRQKERNINVKLQKSNKELEDQKEEITSTLQIVKHLNAQLQAQNNTLNQIAIVSITDLKGSIISVNENFCNVTGYGRDELLGNNHNILNSGEHSKDLFRDMWETILSGRTWRGELKNKKKNGEFFWVDTAIAPVFNDEGKPKQFFSLKFEITKRKNYLTELAVKGQELQDLNNLKDKLLSVVSHDFRGPLNSLRGTLTLFLKGAISNKELNMLTKDLADKLENTYNLLENLLSWAKSQMKGMSVYPKKIEIKSLVDSCINLLSPVAEKKLIKITNKIATGIHVFADNEMVKLVLRNLISNAIKFTSAGDHICIDAQISENEIMMSIQDNGLGISNENQDKIFKPENFSTIGTSNETGMGLGLLLCKDFVEKNNGKIWFESEFEKGSTFYFTLPTIESENQSSLS